MEAFITLTNEDKQVFYLNPRHLLSIAPHKKGSELTTTLAIQTWGINQFVVLETPEEVAGKINRSNMI
jgi:hypothetical protein